MSRTKNAPLFERNVPTLVALVDPGGHIVGRNNSNLSRGDDLAGVVPGAEVVAGDGALGVRRLVREGPLPRVLRRRPRRAGEDHRRARHRPAARRHALARERGDRRAARSSSWRRRATASRSWRTRRRRLPALDDSVDKAAKDTLSNSLSHQQTDVVRDGDLLVAGCAAAGVRGRQARPHRGRVAGVAHPGPDRPGRSCRRSARSPSASCWSSSAGWLLGNYITRPINMLEEGLLAILNGQADKRFELDHAELGGLAFRIDQLLNQLMGVEEDTTDDEGRVSRSPSAAGELHRLARGRRQEDDPGERRRRRSRPRPAPRSRAAGAVLRAHLPRVHRGQEGHRRADRPHQRAGVRCAASRAWSKTRPRSTAGRCATRSTRGTKKSFSSRSRCRRAAVC